MIMTTENQKKSKYYKKQRINKWIKSQLVNNKKSVFFLYIDNKQLKKYFENSTYASIKQTKETLTKVYKTSMQK